MKYQFKEDEKIQYWCMSFLESFFSEHTFPALNYGAQRRTGGIKEQTHVIKYSVYDCALFAELRGKNEISKT